MQTGHGFKVGRTTIAGNGAATYPKGLLCDIRIMSKPEDFSAEAKPADAQTSQLLYEETLVRSADPPQQGGYIRILDTPPPQPAGQGGVIGVISGPNNTTGPFDVNRTRGGIITNPAPHVTETWPQRGSTGVGFPGPNRIQWNGNKPDYSRGQGGTVFQPRGTVWQNAEAQQDNNPITRRPAGPGVAPITSDIPQVDVPRDPQGRPIGPRIIQDYTYPQANPETGARAPLRPDGPVRPDGTIVGDPRSEKEMGMAQLSLMGALAGCLLGMAKGKSWMVAGAVAGLLVGPIVKGMKG
jgi:hypothetical protein